MDYAVTLLFPILGGLLLGYWLNQTFGASPVWIIVLAILGMFGGIGVMYKRYALSARYKTFKPTPKDKQPPGVRHQELDFLYKEYDDDDDEHPYNDDEPDDSPK